MIIHTIFSVKQSFACIWYTFFVASAVYRTCCRTWSACLETSDAEFCGGDAANFSSDGSSMEVMFIYLGVVSQ